MIPTTIKIGAVAAVGTIANKGLKRLEIAKQIATTKAVKPVRPPAPIPAADSTYVVTFEVPAKYQSRRRLKLPLRSQANETYWKSTNPILLIPKLDQRSCLNH